MKVLFVFKNFFSKWECSYGMIGMTSFYLMHRQFDGNSKNVRKISIRRNQGRIKESNHQTREAGGLSQSLQTGPRVQSSPLSLIA